LTAWACQIVAIVILFGGLFVLGTAIYGGYETERSLEGAIFIPIILAGLIMLAAAILHVYAFCASINHLRRIRGMSGPTGKGPAVAGLILSCPILFNFFGILVEIIKSAA